MSTESHSSNGAISRVVLAGDVRGRPRRRPRTSRARAPGRSAQRDDLDARRADRPPAPRSRVRSSTSSRVAPHLAEAAPLSPREAGRVVLRDTAHQLGSRAPRAQARQLARGARADAAPACVADDAQLAARRRPAASASRTRPIAGADVARRRARRSSQVISSACRRQSTIVRRPCPASSSAAFAHRDPALELVARRSRATSTTARALAPLGFAPHGRGVGSRSARPTKEADLCDALR